MTMEYKVGKPIKTFEARAIIGLKVGYSEKLLSQSQVIDAVKKIAKNTDYAFSGTLTETKIIVCVTGNNYYESAVEIFTSIYPRFVMQESRFKKDFQDFIGKVAVELKQERVNIRFTDESILLETKHCKNPVLGK